MRKTYKGGFYTGMNDAARLDAGDAALAPKEGSKRALPEDYSIKAVNNSRDAQGWEAIDGSPAAMDKQMSKDRSVLMGQLDKR